jgi:hypothetical protein
MFSKLKITNNKSENHDYHRQQLEMIFQTGCHSFSCPGIEDADL